MPASLGVHRETFAPLTDWDHVRQSIATILRTPIGSRVLRRDFGSELPDLVDRTMTPQNILAVHVATAVAIAKWEPRFRVSTVLLRRADPDGRLELVIGGEYLPRGHLGDDTPATEAELAVTF